MPNLTNGLFTRSSTLPFHIDFEKDFVTSLSITFVGVVPLGGNNLENNEICSPKYHYTFQLSE